VWGCAEHRSPPGQACQHCADQQGQLFIRAAIHQNQPTGAGIARNAANEVCAHQTTA
jgi:hypothetical protein